jgi:hypothetical protein
MIYIRSTLKTLLRQGFFIPLIVYALLNTHSAYSNNNQHRIGETWLSISSNSYSDAFTIIDLYKDDPTSLQPGGVIYSFNQWVLGHKFHTNISAGVHAGFDFYAQHSDIAAKIYAQKKVSLGQHSYTLIANAQRTNGLFVAFDYKDSVFESQIMLEAGQATELTSVELTGDLLYEENALSGTANIDYFYEKDALYDRELESISKGTYFSMSATLIYRSRLGKHSLHMQDIVNQTQWHSAPYTYVKLNTNRISSIDDNGVITVRPLGSGLETYKSMTQRFPAKINFSNHLYATKNQNFIIGLQSIQSHSWPYIGWEYSPSNFEAIYHYKEHSVSVAHRVNSFISYNINSDHIDKNKIQRFQIGVEVRY